LNIPESQVGIPDAIPEDGFDALKSFAEEIASETAKSDTAFAEEFKSAQTDADRKARIENYYSNHRFRRLAQALVNLDPDWASEYYKGWLISLGRRDYKQIEELMKPHTEIQRSPNGNQIHRPNKIGMRRLTSYAFVTVELLAEADLKRKSSRRQVVEEFLHWAEADSLGENRKQVIVSPTERPAVFRGVVESPAAARCMETYIKSKGLSLTVFASRVGTTDRTLRSFRKTGKIRCGIFDAIANEMKKTKDELMKPG